jgi:3-deoxy-manno-octulosonate cytidylyltransferase (CMP-KDO synthetase)
MGVICVLPARLHSTRISRKPLAEIAGRPLLEWSWRAAGRVRRFDRVVVATDSDEIESTARSFGAEVVRTRSDHLSGTDRVDEAATRLAVEDADVVVNFQGDEPFTDPETVESAIDVLEARSEDRGSAGSADIATLAAPIRSQAEWASPGVVKVVRAADGRALYFSRSPIPHVRDGEPRWGEADFLRHIGVYACRRSALRSWAAMPESRLEGLEKLEQLRILEAGGRIYVEVGPATEPGVDLPADLERAERILAGVG